MSRKSDKRLTTEEFTLLAIEKLKVPDRKGIHTVFSGFNQAFREYFPGLDPIAEVKKLVEAGKIGFRFAKGGAMIYPPGEGVPAPASGKEALKKMGV